MGLRSRGSAGAAVAALVLLLACRLAPPASASTPWGACGLGTAEDKLVTQYAVGARMNVYLRCGGPRWDANPTWGFRHLLARHLEDFERLAVDTNQNWRDVADLAMEAIARDPDAVRPAGSGKACYSRVIFLRSLRTNQVVRTQIIRMYVIVSSGDIITVYPHSAQCP